jgi:hypothetical protein
MSDDQPTQPFTPEPEPEPEPERGPEGNGDSRFKKYFFVLLGAIAALVVLIVVLLLTRGGDDTKDVSDDATFSSTPTATATDSATTPETSEPTPTATETTTAAPAPTGPQLNEFTGTKSVTCNTQAPNPSPQYISFSWSTKGADKIYFGVNTADASTGALFDNLPASGTQNDFPAGYSPFMYNCPSAKQSYTLTIVGDGKKVSKTITVTNNGDTQ